MQRVKMYKLRLVKNKTKTYAGKCTGCSFTRIITAVNLVKNTAIYQILILTENRTDMLQQQGCQLSCKCQVLITGTSVLLEVINKKTYSNSGCFK